MPKQRLALRIIVICILFTAVPLALAQKPSTPEERTRLVTLVHNLESNPLDPGLHSEREWAIKWLIEVPDIHVGMCPSILGDYHKYKYSSEITTQLMLASAAFAIANPDKSTEDMAQYVAAAESALKAYSAILKQDAKANSKPLDEDLTKQRDGKLKESIQDAAKKSCRK